MTEDGEQLVSQIWNPTGDPENTLSWEGVETKFRMMTDGVISTEAQDKLIATCKALEVLEHPGELISIINNGDFRRRY